ncbi:MAG: VWA domain-containing protein [Acidobacteriota bacterium]
MRDGRLLRRTVLQLVAVGLFALGLVGVLLLVGATLASPHWLHLGWAALLVVFLDFRATRKRAKIARLHGDAATVDFLVEDQAAGWRFLAGTLAAWSLLLLAVGCARPQWGLAENPIRRKGVDVFLVVDVSRSMLAEDVKPNRLVQARLAIERLLELLEGDRVGLIAHAGEARVLCPLTLDHSAARLFLETLDPGALDRPGTAIAAALDLAGRSFANDGGRHGVVILLSDGEDHAGQAEEAAQRLGDLGVIVHAIGIGRTEGTPIPLREEGVRGQQGKTFGHVKDREGNAVMTKLDAATLVAVTQATGGQFIPLSAIDAGLTTIAQDITAMDQQEFESTRTLLRTDRHHWFTVPALLLMAVRAALPDGARLRRQRSRRERMVARDVNDETKVA